MILEKRDWKEYHKNGQIWIDGQIGIIAPLWKHLYYYLTGFDGLKGIPVCRLGRWTKYDTNGNIDWILEYDNYGKCIS
jgi:hypothetical protein